MIRVVSLHSCLCVLIILCSLFDLICIPTVGTGLFLKPVNSCSGSLCNYLFVLIAEHFLFDPLHILTVSAGLFPKPVTQINLAQFFIYVSSRVILVLS